MLLLSAYLPERLRESSTPVMNGEQLAFRFFFPLPVGGMESIHRCRRHWIPTPPTQKRVGRDPGRSANARSDRMIFGGCRKNAFVFRNQIPTEIRLNRNEFGSVASLHVGLRQLGKGIVRPKPRTYLLGYYQSCRQERGTLPFAPLGLSKLDFTHPLP